MSVFAFPKKLLHTPLSRRSILAALGTLGLGSSASGLTQQRNSRDLRLSLAMIENYDRTGPVLSGAVKPKGIQPAPLRLGPAELFRRVAQDADIDVSEMSTSTFMMLKSRRDERYTGLPVFPSRNFRHGYIFVNRNSGIRKPEDLKGRRVGVPEYQTTAALWQRALLQDDFGLKAEEMEWFEGGLDEPDAPERFHADLPAAIHLSRIGPGETLSRLLETGKLDAVIGPAEPESFRRTSHVVRLFPDFRTAELEYFKRTGFFPIMHMVVVRTEVYRSHPWVAESLFEAFQEAKRIGFKRLWETWDLASAVPWLLSDLEEIREVFGADHWPYGIAGNRPLLERMTQASFEQGLSPRKLEVNELFAAETWKT